MNNYFDHFSNHLISWINRVLRQSNNDKGDYEAKPGAVRRSPCIY